MQVNKIYRTFKKFLTFIVPALMVLWGCVEEFDPELKSSTGELVIDGSVVRGDSVQQVSISRTTDIGYNEFTGVEGCIVRIEDGEGNVYVLDETESGIYQVVIPEANLFVGADFRMFINTPDGSTYQSEWESILASSSIDSVYYIRGSYQNSANYFSDGIRFYADLKAPEGNSQYYRYTISETYQYSANHLIYGYHWIENDSSIVYDPPLDSIRRCWISQEVSGLYSASTANLTENMKKRIPLNYLSEQSFKISEVYSVLVRQYSLSEAAYTYWEQNRVQAGESGGLYQTQPAQTVTNITNVNEPEEKLYGFFWAGEYTEKRAFFDGPLTSYHYRYACVLYDTFTVAQLDTLTEDSYFTIKYYDSAYNPFYSVAPDMCFDCRLQGGRNKKPDYWP